ncbi:hypothetical protein Thena_0249 [Thermodesulfobium narugense DSM 14796]|uniref:Uncharacterized protein n=1 Tax=Thermodesulfobium narugense DSM 14796 TaxID=747365 RepID=M1E4A4_9BACT|nr:hypothetical protein [Thermodesulfobium narugense]AEE13897.1 hypothetical protein Thena_0249 [Thermodesulfobium narugense DSM 14796]
MFKIISEEYKDYLLSLGENLILVPQENVGKIIYLKGNIDHIECIRNFRKHLFSREKLIEFVVFLNDNTSFRAISDEKIFLKLHQLAKYTKCESPENISNKNVFSKQYLSLILPKVPIILLILSTLFAFFVFTSKLYNNPSKIFYSEPYISIIYPQGDSIELKDIENGLYLEVESNFNPKEIDILVDGSIVYQKSNSKDVYYQWFPPNPGIYKIVARSQFNGRDIFSKTLTVYAQVPESKSSNQANIEAKSIYKATKIVIGNPVTMYSSPDESVVVGTIDNGSKVEVIERAVSHNSKLYMLKEDLSLYTDGVFINLKKGQLLRLYDFSGDIFTLLYKNSDSIGLVRLQREYLQKVDTEEWYKVIYNKKEGWISSFFTR